MAIVVPKRKERGKGDGGTRDCVEFLILKLERAGLIVNRVVGMWDEFIKVNRTEADLTLWFDRKELHVQRNESLLKRMEEEDVAKQVFPMHDEPKRKQLLRSWALNWLDFTWQPIHEIYLLWDKDCHLFCFPRNVYLLVIFPLLSWALHLK